MPQIEIVPNSTAVSAPGWAYVLDTGSDPSKAPIQPTGPRQRNTRNVGIGAGGQEPTARQNNAILKHLAELDKDNHREVQIPISGKGRETGRISKTKITPNVRRILLSQKTFANHLADEEALLSLQPPGTISVATSTPRPGRPPNPSTPVAKSTKKQPGKKTPLTHAKRLPTTTTPFQPSPLSGVVSPASIPNPPSASTTQSGPPPVAPARETVHPLLESHIPSAPSEATLEALLSAPPLTYAAARAAPSTSHAPPRQFCEICGFWGRIKCLKCQARVCGLECKGVHDEGRCLKFYA